MVTAYVLRQRSRRQITFEMLSEQIKALYDQDFTDQEIAERVRINGEPVDRSYITRARNMMGLAPRWGRKNGFVFTRQNDADILDLKKNTNLSWALIAFLINMPVGVVYARHQLLLTMAETHCETRQPQKRRCQSCREWFLTDQPRQVHMCEACHKRIESLGSSFDDYA
jgi:hypothetical protein